MPLVPFKDGIFKYLVQFIFVWYFLVASNNFTVEIKKESNVLLYLHEHVSGGFNGVAYSAHTHLFIFFIKDRIYFLLSMEINDLKKYIQSSLLEIKVFLYIATLHCSQQCKSSHVPFTKILVGSTETYINPSTIFASSYYFSLWNFLVLTTLT